MKRRRSGRMATGALSLVGLFSTTAPAAALCMGPGTFLAPLSGTALPKNPTLFLFVPGPRETMPAVRAWTAGGERPIAVSLLSEQHAFTSYRIDVAVDAEGVLKVEIPDPRWESRILQSEFTVFETVPRVPAPAAVLAIEPEILHWTCSYQETQNIRLSSVAPAYLVEWSETPEDYESGRRQALVVPASMRAFFDPSGEEASFETLLELGHVNCFGRTLEWSGKAPLYVGIAALHADGSEERVLESPLRLRRPERLLLDKLSEDYVRPFLYAASFYFVRTIELFTGYP